MRLFYYPNRLIVKFYSSKFANVGYNIYFCT